MACLESARVAIPSLVKPEPESRATSQQLPTPAASPSTSPTEDEDEDEEEDGDEPEPAVPWWNLARCPRCLKSFPKGSMADHRKTHLLSRGGTEGQLVSRSSACSHCRRRGHRCIVAKRPSHEALRTVRCLQCLVDREGCSFAKAYKHLDVRTLSEHPAAHSKQLPTS